MVKNPPANAGDIRDAGFRASHRGEGEGEVWSESKMSR